MATPSTIPTIDISSYLSGDPTSTASVVAAIRHAAISSGFFQVTGHGISTSRKEQILDLLRGFFNLPQATKDALRQDLTISFRGYEPINAQQFGDKGVPDMKEGLVWGSENSPTDGDMIIRGPNKWPAEVDLPGFRDTMARFYVEGLELGRTLLGALALGLDLPRDYFDAVIGRGDSNSERVIHSARAHRYLPGNDKTGMKGVGAHTDFGAITLLMQDDVGGLEVFDRGSQTWLPVHPAKDALVVNLGDLMSRWTNDKYLSNLHRVVSPVGQSRYSLALFLMGNPDYLVECLPSCVDEGKEPKYEAITVRENLMNRVASAYNK